MAMHNPPHPGEFIRETYIEPFDISIRSLAENLGVAASTLARVVAERSAVSPEMALRLSKALGRSPESWLAISVRGKRLEEGGYDCVTEMAKVTRTRSLQSNPSPHCRNSAYHAPATKQKGRAPEGSGFLFSRAGYESAEKRVQPSRPGARASVNSRREQLRREAPKANPAESILPPTKLFQPSNVPGFLVCIRSQMNPQPKAHVSTSCH
jgi:addiction module HigA family antidote